MRNKRLISYTTNYNSEIHEKMNMWKKFKKKGTDIALKVMAKVYMAFVKVTAKTQNKILIYLSVI